MGLRGVSVDVDVEIVFPLARACRARLEARHRDAVLLQRNQQVVHRAGFVGDRNDQARAVLARGRRHGQRVGQADDGKARSVVGLVLDGVRNDVQAELRGRAFAGQGRPGRVGGGQARTLGVAGDGAALGVRQVLGQPGLALRQGLRVGQHGLDAVERIGLAQQVVAHQQAHFAHHMRG